MIAMISGGYSDYAYYDGAQFALKGYITTAGSEEGSLIIERKKVAFVRGGISNLNVNFTIRFGQWGSTEEGANYSFASLVEFQNSRYPFWSAATSNIQIYGTIAHGASMKPNDLTENSNIGYYHGGSAMTYRGYFVEAKDSMFTIRARGVWGIVRDLKWNETNNWSGSEKIRLIITAWNSSHAWAIGKFYACKFTMAGKILRALYDYTVQYSIRLYDCNFIANTDN